MRTIGFYGLVLVAALLAVSPAWAQKVGPRMGVIPGTSMTRDEFRARAQADLAAVALNAVTYRIAKGSYATDFYELQASPAWNLRVANMFTGRPIQAIYFEPGPDNMTSAPSVGLGGLELPQMPPMGNGSGEMGQVGKEKQPPIQLNPLSGVTRVDPGAIRDYEAGDVYYYVKGDLLQLILYAPDGSFFEWVDEVPNANFRINLQLRPDQPAENLYAAQVLYYVESLAAQHYNLVQFMSDGTTVPGAQLASLPGSKKIELAGRIGITVVNPVTKKPETASTKSSPGVVLEGTPLKIATATGPALAMTEMTMGREDMEHTQSPKPKVRQQPKVRPGQVPPGGPTPGAPGGGRH
jgi:hypothetical protein